MWYKSTTHTLWRSAFILCLEWAQNPLLAWKHYCLKVWLAVLVCLDSLTQTAQTNGTPLKRWRSCVTCLRSVSVFRISLLKAWGKEVAAAKKLWLHLLATGNNKGIERTAKAVQLVLGSTKIPDKSCDTSHKLTHLEFYDCNEHCCTALWAVRFRQCKLSKTATYTWLWSWSVDSQRKLSLMNTANEFSCSALDTSAGGVCSRSECRSGKARLWAMTSFPWKAALASCEISLVRQRLFATCSFRLRCSKEGNCHEFP